MRSEWKELSLGEFVRLQRGHDLTASEQRPGNVPVMGSAGPNGSHSEALAKGPGVVIGRSGASIGRVHYSTVDYWPHNTCLYVTDFLGNLPPFAYYLLRTLDLAGYNSGSAQPSLNRNYIYGLRLQVPPPADQAQIVTVLQSLDDRIDLLRQTNSTLESIAQALFKSWFIDFDPVRAKAEGREPEGMDAATAALFPAEFEESELGAIPKGWAVQPVGDLVEAVGGSTPDTKNEAFWEPAVHYWTSPKDLSGATAPVLLDTERKVSGAGLAKISSGLLPVGTLLMSSRAPIGYLSLSQVPVAINQGYIAMPPGSRLPPAHMYFWCQHNMDAIKGRANGSTFMEISKKAFRPIPALLPSPEVVNKFHDFATAVFSRVTANERQARALAELRDTLLPRLISGKLRLPEAQEQLADAIA